MRSGWTPSIVPNDRDVTVYIVEDDFGNIGKAYRETDAGQADLETTINDVLSGQYNATIRVVSFKRRKVGLKTYRKILPARFNDGTI